jgi:hypothetical protein
VVVVVVVGVDLDGDGNGDVVVSRGQTIFVSMETTDASG